VEASKEDLKKNENKRTKQKASSSFLIWSKWNMHAYVHLLLHRTTWSGGVGSILPNPSPVGCTLKQYAPLLKLVLYSA